MAITTIALTTTVLLEVSNVFSPKEKDNTVKVEYDDAYFNEMAEKSFDTSLFIFNNYTDATAAPDGKTTGYWLTGIDMDYDYTSFYPGVSNNNVARARYFEDHAIIIPEMTNNRPVVGVDFETRGKNVGATRDLLETSMFSLVKMVKVPKSVKAIKSGSFFGFVRLEYLDIPFIGTERGSSGNGMNLSLTEIRNNYGPNKPSSDSFGTMFGVPFDSSNVNRWEVQYHTSWWNKWTWDNDARTSGQADLIDTENATNLDDINPDVVRVLWQELSGGSDNPNDPAASYKFTFLLPKSLKRLIVSDDTKIGNNALTSCPALKIEVPNYSGSSLMIGNYAFSECSKTTEIILPTRPNVSFRKGAFNMCQSLEKIILPPAINDIGISMFFNAVNLKIIYMPASVQNIGDGAFYGCNLLERIALYSGNDSSKLTGDFEADSQNGAVLSSSYKFNLPAALKTIGTNAFYGCNHMDEINVPESVQSIGYAAFGQCYNLTKMLLPFIGAHSDSCDGENNKNNCELDKLGGDKHFHGLFGWIFGSTGSTVGDMYQATQKYLNDGGGEEIYSFYIPSKLTDVTIRGETKIQHGALQSLKNIENLTINEAVGDNIAAGALNGCSMLKSLSISSVTNHLGDLFKGDEFENSIVTRNDSRVPLNLKTIVVTNQVHIPTGAFDHCTRIENVEIGTNTQIMESAIFYNNEMLTNLIIPFKGRSRGNWHQNYWWWGDNAIRNSVAWLFSTVDHSNTYCNRATYWWYLRYIPNRLKSLTVTDDTSINTYAFRGMSSLETISITNVPNNIDNYSFSGCSGLQEIHIPYIGYDLNPTGKTGYQHTLGYIFGSSEYEGSYPAEQGGSVFYIPEKLSIVKVGAPGREEQHMSNKIFDYAFQNCESITTIDFYQANIHELGIAAFQNCVNLSRINYPNAQYMHVGDYAFYNCQKVLDIDDFTPNTVTTIGNYSFYQTSVGNKVKPGVAKGELVIDKYTSIGDYAFGNCLQVEKVSIPSSLSFIGEGMFAGCAYLRDVTLTNNKNVSKYMFKDCVSLEGIDLSGITSIPEGLLQGCKNLLWDTEYNEGLIYDTNTTEIGKYAFAGCSGLDQFILNNALKTIDEGAFQGCKGIEYMTIPRETTVINPYGWIGCNDNFFFYVYEPEENWPKTWVNNWNCDYPVYVLGQIKDDVYTYVFDVVEKKFYITGLTPTGTLNGIITIPHMHNGIQVVGIDESRRTEEDILAGAKDIKTQMGISKVILPKSITKIVGDPFATGMRVDVYTELTKDEVTKIYNDHYAVLEEEFTQWKKDNSTASETQIENTRINIFKKIKGWLPFAPDRTGVCSNSNSENPGQELWDERNWITGGFLYYKDYWQYGTGVSFNIPYLNIGNFKFTLTNYDNHYTGKPIEQYVSEIQLVGEIFENEEIGVTRSLLFIGGRSSEFSPLDLLGYKYSNNVDVGTATLECEVSNDILRDFNREWTSLVVETDNGMKMPNALHALYLVGKVNLHYKIQKSLITVKSISGNFVTKVYDGQVYRYETWANGEISGLEGFVGAQFSGRIETNRENVGLYGEGTGLYWGRDWRVTLNGRNITDNFTVKVEFMVNIIPMEVEVKFTKSDDPINGVYQFVDLWEGENTYNYNGREIPLLNYPYIGGQIKPYAVAVNVETQEVVNKSICQVVATHMDNNQIGTFPYGENGMRSTYLIYAYIHSSHARNFKLKIKQADGTYIDCPDLVLGATSKVKAVPAAYRVGKGKITIRFDEKYTISPYEDYWVRRYGYRDTSDGVDIHHDNLEGLGTNSYLVGALRSTGDEQAVYSAKFDSTVGGGYPGTHTFQDDGRTALTWDNLFKNNHLYLNYSGMAIDFIPSEDQPFIIFNPVLKIADETKYYDVILDGRIQIFYNNFNPSYFIGMDNDEYMDNRNPNYLVYPRTITEETEGNRREYEYIEYMVDGELYKLTVDDLTAFGNRYPNYTVEYYKDDGESLNNEGPQFQKIGEYVYMFQMSARHYNTLAKNIKLKTVKSNIVIGNLDKVYDRNPVDPVNDGKILKIGKDQTLNLEFRYFDINGNPLGSAPRNAGSYSVRITAPEGEYFNAYDQTHRFKISKRKVYINISGEKTFDQNIFSLTPMTSDLLTNSENPDGGLLVGDEFVGTIQTNGFEPQTYRYPDDFIWAPDWSIYYSDDNSDVSMNYDVIVRGSYRIKPLEFVYEAGGYKEEFDGYYHTGYVTVLYPTPDNYAPAFTPDVAVKWSLSDLDVDSSSWLSKAPAFVTPGKYELYYKIEAPYFRTIKGRVIVEIIALTMEYTDPAMDESDGSHDHWIFEYDARSHEFEVIVTKPAAGAKVSYSVNGSAFTTEIPLLINYGTYNISYKIEAPNYKDVEERRVVKIVFDMNDPDNEGLGDPMDIDDYYANFYKGEYDGQEHQIEAGFSDAFLLSVGGEDNTHIFYSLDGGNTWTDKNPVFKDIGKYEITVKYSAKGYRDAMLQGIVEITGLQLDITTIPYKGFFDGQYHMIGLDSKTATLRFNDVTKTYFYKTDKIDEEVELKFYYTTDPNVVGGSGGWLPTVVTKDGKAVVAGIKDAGIYTVYVRIEAKYFDTLVIEEYTSLVIDRLENPDISMDSPQQFEYSKAPLDTSKIVVDTIADGERAYYFYSAYWDNGVPKYDEPLNRILPPEELGIYYVVVRVAPSRNCAGCEISGYVEIVPRVLEVQFTNPQYYDGTLKTPDAYVVTGTSDVIHLYTAIRGTVEPIDVGFYEFDVTMVEKNPNYVLSTNIIEMEIRKRNLFFYLKEECLAKEDGSIWTHLDSQYYDRSNQVGDNRWHMLGDMSGTHTFYNEDTKQFETVTYAGLAPGHALSVSLKTRKGQRNTYFKSNVFFEENEYYANVIDVEDLNIYEIDGNGNYVLENGMPKSVLDFYDVDYYIMVDLVNPDVNLNDLEIRDTYTYDGLLHTVQVNLPSYLKGGYIRYRGSEGIYGSTPPKFINVGEYEIRYLVGADGYEETYGSVILKILAADLDIQIGDMYRTEDLSKTPHDVYDDKPHKHDYTVENILSGKIQADVFKYYSAKDYEYDVILEYYSHVDPNNLVLPYGLDRLTEAGHYFLVIYFKEDNMRWNESFVVLNVELKQRELHIEIPRTDDIVKVYDGQKIVIPLTEASIVTERTETSGLVQNHTINQTLEMMKQYSVQTISADAGEYDLLTQFEFGFIDIRRTDGKVIDQENYRPVIHGNFNVIIEKAYLKEGDFTVEPYKEKVYDGYRHEPNYWSISDGELLITYFLMEDVDGNINITELKGDQKNVGHYQLQVSIGEGKNYHSWEDSYWIMHLVDAPYLESEILCTPKEVEVQWEDTEQTFTGESLSIKPWIIDAETDHENEIRVDLVASYWDNDIYDWVSDVVNQGTYLALAQFDTTTTIGQTYNKNYILTNDTQYFVILYLTLKIQLGDGEETNDIVYYNTQTVWRSELYKENTPNAAEILAETPELQAWLENITLTSSADPQAPASISAKDYMPGTYRGDRFDINCTIRNKYGVDVTKSINFEIIGSVTVKRDEIDFTTKDVTLVYKENKNDSTVVGYTFEELECLAVSNPKSGYTVSNFVINGINYGHTFQNLSQAGEYDISFDILASGYEAQRASVHVTITQFPAYMTFATNLTKAYDGSPVDVSKLVETSASGFNGTVSDLIIEYFELVYENGQYFEKPFDSIPLNVGKYRVHITSAIDQLDDVQKNYTELDVVQDFDITAKEIKLTLEEDMELLSDELLGKSWTSKLYTYGAGDNPYIMSGDVLQLQFSTDVFTRGNYIGSKILKVTTEGALDATNTTNMVTESGKIFNVSWRLLKANDKGEIIYDEYEDPNDPTGPKLKVPRDVSPNYSISLILKLSVHYPYIPVTIEGVEVDYDKDDHFGSITFADFTSADTSISFPKDWFEQNAVQLYSINRDELTNSPETCKTSIEQLAFSDPGSYVIYYKIDVKDNATSLKFESNTGSYIIKINKLERTVVETQTLDKQYDGQAAGNNRNGRYFPNFEVTHDDESIVDEYIIEDLEIIYKQAGLTSVIDAQIGCIDSGIYVYSLIIPETRYYKQSTLQGSFIISKIRVYIEDKSDFERAIFQYDGLVKSVLVTEDSSYYQVGTRQSPEDPIDPLALNGLMFEATLVTRSIQVKKYVGADTSLILFNYEYKITDLDGNDVSNNYLIDYSKASIEIIPISMKYQINHPVYVYDNQYHPFSIYISTPSNTKLVKIEYYDEVIGEWTTKPIMKRDVGTYEVKVRMFADNYQPSGEITLPMTIEPAETIIEYVSNLSRVYDGNEVTMPEIIMTNRDDAFEGTLRNHYTYRYYRYDEDGNLLPDPIYEQHYDFDLEQVVANGKRAVDVGRYRMELEIPASDNFTAVTYSDDFVISSFVTDLTWRDLKFVYDGKSHTPEAYLQLVPTDKLSGEIKNIVIDVQVTPAVPGGDINHKNKGTYIAEASINYQLSDDKIKNYIIGDKTRRVTFVIQPRTTVITLNYPQALYKGEVDYLMHYNSQTGYKFTASNIVPEHKITDYIKLNYDGPREYNKPSDFIWMDGVNNVALSNQTPRIYDEFNVDVTDNYIMGYSYLFVLSETITDAAVSITNYAGVYDGQWHTIEVDLLVDDPSQFTIKYWVIGQSKVWSTTKPRRMDVGQDQIAVRIEREEQGVSRVVFEGTAGITITKADPEIEFEDLYFRLGKTYDGVPIVNPTVTYNGATATGVKYTYYEIDENGNAHKLTSNPINAGKYRLDVEVPATNNYNSVVHSFDIFEITPRTITIHIKTQTKMFDYLSWTHKVEDHEVENLVKGHTLQSDSNPNNGILMTTSPEVGEYTLLGMDPGFQWQTNSLRIYDKDGFEVNSPRRENYVVNLLADVTIVGRQFSVDFGSKAFLYDGDPHFITARINGTVKPDGTVEPYVYVSDFDNDVLIEYGIYDKGKYEYGVDIINRIGIGVYNIRVRISAPNYETLIKEAYLAILDPNNPNLPPELTDPDDPDDPSNDPDNPDWPGPNDADKFPFLEFDKNKVYDKLPYNDPVYINNAGGNHVVQYYLWDDYLAYAQAHKLDETVVLDESKAMSSNPVNAGRYVFVFKIDDQDLTYPGKVIHQEFKIYPRPVDVVWSDLNQQWLGGTPQLPTAYYEDIDGNRVDCTVKEPQYATGTFSVVASTDDTNYLLNNPNAKFNITKNVIDDIVLVPPENGYETGEPIIIEDTNGNKYIPKEEFDKDPSIVEDPEHTFIVDEDGNILKYDPTKDEWVDAELPWTMEIDPDYVDPDTGEHKVNVDISLKDPENDSWKENGKDDIHYDFPLKPQELPSEKYNLVFDYTEVWVHTGNPIEPEVTVYLRDVDTNEMTLFDPKYYNISYNNNIEVTTEDSKAEILFTSVEGSKYFFEDITQYFTITASKPEVLELNDDALIMFINAKYENGAAIIIEDGTVEHLMAGEEGLYLGHIHQETLIPDIIKQFKNNPEKLVVTNPNGDVIEKEEYENYYFGNGWTVSLTDDGGQVIDSVQAILYGDVDCDGSILGSDLINITNYLDNDYKYQPDEAYIYFACITSDRTQGIFTAAALIDIVNYLDDASAHDFNSFDGKYSSANTDEPIVEVALSVLYKDEERYNL